MANPVVSPVLLVPSYETSMRKCERCPTRYLEVKRIGEDGYRLCSACWLDLAADTIVYGLDSFARQASMAAVEIEEEESKNNLQEGATSRETDEAACYARQVAANKDAKKI